MYKKQSQPKGNDLGKDRVGHLLFKLALPAIVAQLVNMLYNIVDRMFIGHIPGIGATALTGVGVTFPIIMFIFAFSDLIGSGGAPQASIQMGRKNNKAAENILGNCLASLLVVSIVLTIFFLAFLKPLLLLFGASTETLPYASAYLQIYLCGTIFVLISSGLNSFITAQGFARISMFTVILGATLNIILDPLFIFGFHLGVQGAALATVIAQAISSLWVLRFLLGQTSKWRIRKQYFKLQSSVLWPVLALGISPFIMKSTESLLNIAFNISLQHYGGDIAVGSMTILFSIMQMLFLPLVGLTQGSQPIVGFNYGAQNYTRVKQAFRLLLISCLVFSCGYWLILMLFPKPFISFFNNDPTLVSTTVWAVSYTHLDVYKRQG